MEYFKIKEEELESLGAIHTAREIWEQPSVWKSTARKLINEQEELRAFWEEAVQNSRKIILTGAGTSAFIGYSLEGAYQRYSGITTLSVPTTHLVTHPLDYLQPEIPTLVVSFARSGNSPESVAAVRLTDKICRDCYHLVITCDENGQLARYQTDHRKFNFILPPGANDKSLAMTVSYTSMLLAGLMIPRLDQPGILEKQVEILIRHGRKFIDKYSDSLREIAALDFGRAVFLGSGPLYGTATESHLKLQELTDGRIICKNDSYLAFRHGPKAVIDERTIVFFLFSNNDCVQQYERDLVLSMRKGKKAMRLIGISDSPVKGVELDAVFCFSGSGSDIEEEFLAICSVLPAQITALFKSLDLGLKPDNPSVSGAISRVVEGVIIYEEEEKSPIIHKE
jgi:tagatose-6-phosphate ketose/aldose isomerase